jgi:hypothetical protein
VRATERGYGESRRHSRGRGSRQISVRPWLRSRSTSIGAVGLPLVQAQSSTPTTRISWGAAEHRAAVLTWRIRVCRLTFIPSRLNNGWPGRPPNARPTTVVVSPKRLVCRPYGAKTPATRSVKIWRPHSRLRQRQRPSRTDLESVMRMVTAVACSGRSLS